MAIQLSSQIGETKNYNKIMFSEFGISRCKQAYIEWLDILYSTGNQIQYPVVNHPGKEYERLYIYVIKTGYY